MFTLRSCELWPHGNVPLLTVCGVLKDDTIHERLVCDIAENNFRRNLLQETKLSLKIVGYLSIRD